ncbi:hypothetical protein [Thermosphaera sp.]
MLITPRILLVLALGLLLISIALSFLGSYETLDIVEGVKNIEINEPSFYTLNMLLQDARVFNARRVEFAFFNEGANPVKITFKVNETIIHSKILLAGETDSYQLTNPSVFENVVIFDSTGTRIRVAYKLETTFLPYAGLSILALILLVIGTILLIQYVAVKVSLKTEK